LRPPDPTSAFFRFNIDAMPSLKLLNLSTALFSVFAADTFYAMTLTLTFDLEHLQCIVCDVMKLFAKSERNRASCGGVIAISIFDLMTLNMCHVLRSALR